MFTNSISCTVNTLTQVDRILYRLKDHGFSAGAMSVLFAPSTHAQTPGDSKSNTSTEGRGSLTRGALGWLPGAGTLSMPGGCWFVAAGPVLAALSGSAKGTSAGYVHRALMELGIPEIEAELYENRVHAGAILISVHTDDPGELDDAMTIFERLEARDIASTRARISGPLPAGLAV